MENSSSIDWVSSGLDNRLSAVSPDIRVRVLCSPSTTIVAPAGSRTRVFRAETVKDKPPVMDGSVLQGRPKDPTGFTDLLPLFFSVTYVHTALKRPKVTLYHGIHPILPPSKADSALDQLDRHNKKTASVFPLNAGLEGMRPGGVLLGVGS